MRSRSSPESRIVYVDNDPVVLAHARALLTSAPEGATDYIDADLRDADQILAKAAETLDFSQPVAIMLMAILQHLSDEHDPYAVVAQLMAAVPAGSYLALSHPAKDIHAAEMAEMANRLNQMMAEKVTFRSPGRGGAVLRRPGAHRAGDDQRARLAARDRGGSEQPGCTVGRRRAQALRTARPPEPVAVLAASG